MYSITLRAGIGALVLTTVTTAALAQDCPTINFDNLPVGEAVTTDYTGVTFSLVGTGCPAGTVFPRIITPTGGTSSGSRALGRDGGCPDFYPGILRMVFDDPQAAVHFRLGEWGTGTYAITAYDAAVGGAVVDSATIGLAGATTTAVYYPVVMTGPGILRIDIDQSADGQPVIDDLQFPVDTTAPTASFSPPPPEGSCVCNLVQIRGTALDPDGTGVTWRLHRRGVGAAGWTLITSSSTPVDDAVLVTWNTAAAEGYFTWRLTVTNDCGLVNTATWLVYLERDFSTPVIRYPGPGGIVGGSAVCIDGTVWDLCPDTMATYTVEYAPLPAVAPFADVDPANPTYVNTVINDPFASWNTIAGDAAVADGSYRLRVTGYDICGDSSEATQDVIVDNTLPTAAITSPSSCSRVSGIVAVSGTANDANMGSWALYYAGGDASDWVLIDSGAAAVIGGALGDWDTDGLRPCGYLLRLVVDDAASLNCSGLHNRKEFTVAVDVGCPGDFNRSGAVSTGDLFEYLAAFFAACP